MGILTSSNSINIPFSIDFLVSIIRFFTSRNLFHPYPHQHFAFRVSFLVHIANFSFISFTLYFLCCYFILFPINLVSCVSANLMLLLVSAACHSWGLVSWCVSWLLTLNHSFFLEFYLLEIFEVRIEAALLKKAFAFAFASYLRMLTNWDNCISFLKFGDHRWIMNSNECETFLIDS